MSESRLILIHQLVKLRLYKRLHMARDGRVVDEEREFVLRGE